MFILSGEINHNILQILKADGSQKILQSLGNSIRIVNQKGSIALNWIEVYSLTKILLYRSKLFRYSATSGQNEGVNKVKPKQNNMAVSMVLDYTISLLPIL